ncbi:MAG TPA: hypothetical protein VHZ78_15445 [Rhizomicrobium sp.]|jgi:hypothetical protein|nr:hypothetical protein [Rhizomicrobium sp.]
MKRSLLFLFLLFAALPAFAASDWDGTWAGNWQGGDGVQVIMAGNVATGIFWHGDYLPDALHSTISHGGKTLTITWDHSTAVLTRDENSETGFIAIREPGGKLAMFPVKLDR